MKKEKTYIDKVHTWGKISSITTLAFLLALPLAICINLNVFPSFTSVLKGLLGVIPLFWTTAVIEVFTYGPLLGAGGTYLSFVTGNITNLKLPCGLNAMESAKVRPNSEEGEIISTIAIATSAIVTTIVIAVGVVLFSPILPKMTAEDSIFRPAFDQVMPALFGSLGASYFAKHWKIAVVPVMALVLILVIAPTLQVGVLIPISVVISLLTGHIMFKKKIVQ